MIRKLPAVVAVAVLTAGVTLAFAHPNFSSGPLPGFTGAPVINGLPEEGTCVACHVGKSPLLNLPGGRVQILDLPESFNPGLTYRMRVRLESDSTQQFLTRRWGFELTAVNLTTGDGAGTFTVRPDSIWVRDADPFDPWPTRQYVVHDSDGYFEGETGPVEWSFDWTAPPTSIGPVGFYVAGNAANGDGSNGEHDFIYTSADSMQDSTTAVRPSSWGAIKANYRR